MMSWMTQEACKKLKVQNTAFKSSDEAVFKTVRASLNRAFMLEGSVSSVTL